MIPVTIYTDGSCEPNPGIGGWAAILRCAGGEKEISGALRYTTNNRMELRAAIEALSILKVSCEIDLYTDSQYLRKGVTMWMEGWKKRGWKRKDGDLLNADLWKKLDECIQGHRITWNWVRGHNGDIYNEKVDALAQSARIMEAYAHNAVL